MNLNTQKLVERLVELIKEGPDKWAVNPSPYASTRYEEKIVLHLRPMEPEDPRQDHPDALVILRDRSYHGSHLRCEVRFTGENAKLLLHELKELAIRHFDRYGRYNQEGREESAFKMLETLELDEKAAEARRNAQPAPTES